MTFEVGKTVARLCIPQQREQEEKEDTKGEEARSPHHFGFAGGEMHRKR